jgi:AcrR family transcriptional regulator
VDQVILTATLNLLGEHGYARLTIEGIALQAGMAKTTLYRRWPTKESLVLDALTKVAFADRPEIPDMGSLREDMLTYLRAWISFRRIHAWAGEVLADPELALLFRQKFGPGITSGFRTIIERAVGRGELAPQTDVELMAILPMALVQLHRVVVGKPADQALARRIADQFFNATTSCRPGRGNRS